MRLTRVLVKSRHFGMSALPLKADMVQHDRDVRFVPKADKVRRSKEVALFDHLVCATQQRQWYVEAKPRGGFEIDH